MDPNGLEFDVDAMLAGLQPWVEWESPTWTSTQFSNNGYRLA